jgi:hypothetical protein
MDIGSATVETLIALLERRTATSGERNDAAEALGQRRAHEAIPVLTEALAEGWALSVTAANALVAIGDRRVIPALEAAYARSKEVCAGTHIDFSEKELIGLLAALLRFRDKAELDELLETGDAGERFFANWEVSARMTERRLRDMVAEGIDLAVAVRALHVAGGDERGWLGRAVAALTGVSEEEGRLVVVNSLYDESRNSSDRPGDCVSNKIASADAGGNPVLPAQRRPSPQAPQS